MRYSKYSNQSRDPREMTARFDSVCAETGKPIKKGEKFIYYPVDKTAYHVDSKQAGQFRGWQQDLSMGWDY